MFNIEDDIRIEIMQALLNNAIISKEAFTVIASLFDDVSGESDNAWEAYKALFGATSAVVPN